MPGSPISPQAGAQSCQLVPSGFGPTGATPVIAVPVVTGLEVPWDIAFLPGGTDWLVTERPGRLRLVRQNSLMTAPVMTVDTVSGSEGGLLGIALDPQFQQNSYFYVYLTAQGASGYVNRVQRYVLSADHTSATADQVILDNIIWNTIHNGGRIKFGPDGMLYVSTGEGADATAPENAASLSGKILRIARDGSIPLDNPQPGLPWFIKGIRNSEAFDWWDSGTLLIADNGPTGEYEGRVGGDKLLIAQKGNDTGWPTIWHCETQAGLVSPILTWTGAVPPGGLLINQGDDIPGWKGSILIASTGAEHLHRVVLGVGGTVASHEVYLQGASGIGRERSVLQGPNGEIYLTTTNCDGRGTCPSGQDGIYRLVSGAGSH
jgi:glucose/arabinose dehydrogenase